MDAQQIGFAVGTWRRMRRMSQQQLADACGLSRNQIANREVGRADVTLADAAKIADALNVEICQLLTMPADTTAKTHGGVA